MKHSDMNLFTRRWFLGGLAAAAAPGRAFAVAADSPARGKVNFTMGVLSDVHLRGPETLPPFVAALEYFRDHGADAVMIAGDIADNGRRAQLKLCADAWYRVFPDDRAPDGRRVEKLFVYGNHCVTAWTWGSREKQSDPAYRAEHIILGESEAQVWEECFHEKYEPIWIKEVKGYKIVGAHWDAWKNGALAKFFDDHRAELAGAKPFFYTQHPHPKGTCMGDWAWGGDATATPVLSQFPNCFAFSGHSHYSLTDERTVWQGAFCSVNTSSLSYTSLDYNLVDNAGGNGWGYQNANGDRLTPRLNTGNGKQGMLVTVTDAEVRLSRREFVWGESLGDDWVIPLGTDEKPMDFSARSAKRSAPEFAEGAKAEAAFFEERGNPGKDGKPGPVLRRIKVTFPAAKTVDGCRVYSYEVVPVLLADGIDLPLQAKRVLAPDFHLPVSQAGKPGICVFDAAKLPRGANLRFDVRPVECFGRRGRAVSAALRT